MKAPGRKGQLAKTMKKKERAWGRAVAPEFVHFLLFLFVIAFQPRASHLSPPFPSSFERPLKGGSERKTKTSRVNREDIVGLPPLFRPRCPRSCPPHGPSESLIAYTFTPRSSRVGPNLLITEEENIHLPETAGTGKKGAHGWCALKDRRQARAPRPFHHPRRRVSGCLKIVRPNQISQRVQRYCETHTILSPLSANQPRRKETRTTPPLILPSYVFFHCQACARAALPRPSRGLCSMERYPCPIVFLSEDIK